MTQQKRTKKQQQILTLLSMTCATSLIFLNATLLPVALPTIQRELAVSTNTLHWIINAYLLSTAVFVIAGGRIGDLFGHRKIFCFGITIYAFASAMGGLAHSGWWLVMSRAIQGMGGAMMSPSAMSIIVHTFPIEKRGKAIGTMIAFGSLFLTLGPLIGGAFTQYLSWRWAFWINIPLGLLGVLMTLNVVPKSKPLDETFDLRGFVALSLGLFCLTLGLMQGKTWGWGTLNIWLLFGLAAIFFGSVKLMERFVAHPFFDFRLFKNRTFLGGSLLIVCSQFILMITVFWPLYFQTIFMDSPLIAGLLTTVASIPLMIVAPIGGAISDRRGPRLPIAIGFLSLMGCFIWFSTFLSYHSIPMLLPALFLFGMGISFVMTPAGTTTVSSVPPTKTGVATGMYNMLRFTGATIGVAVLGGVQANVQDSLFTRSLKCNPSTAQLSPSKYEGLLLGLEPSLKAISELSQSAALYVKTALIQATVTSFSITNLVTGGVALIALIITFTFFKAGPFQKESRK